MLDARRHLVLGGARSGKSQFAENLALSYGKQGQQLIYLASAQAHDSEMQARILQHQQRRQDANWQVIEEPIEVVKQLKTLASQHSCILFDCLSLWLSNLMFKQAEIDQDDIKRHLQTLIDAISTLPGQLIMVTNMVGLGVIPMGECSRIYVDLAGWLEQNIAKQCQQVDLVVAGLAMNLKHE